MNPSPQKQEPHDATEDEVRTPPWLTATGIGLFVLACVGWLMTRPPQPTLEQLRASASPPAPSAERPAPAVAPTASMVARPRSSMGELPRPVFKPQPKNKPGLP